MGLSGSKPALKKDDKYSNFMARLKTNVEDELARRMMIQREIQMAVQIAKARDTLWIFGSAWATLVTGAGAARMAGRHPPPILGVPIVVGALALGNMADMAYGNKLARVTKEAEYIMDHERGRFVPPQQAPFAKLYSEEEKAYFFDPATAVGDLFPNRYIARGSGSVEGKSQ